MATESAAVDRHGWWQDLRHEGLFLDVQRLRDLVTADPEPLPSFREQELRRAITIRQDGGADSTGDFVAFVLEKVCGFAGGGGTWQRGAAVPAEWSRIGSTGETIRPRQLWTGPRDAVLPVFFEAGARVGVGRGRRTLSQVLQWLRAGAERLALLTNGDQWRLVFAGIDFHASVEWDVESWFEEGGVSRRLTGFRSLLAPALWTPPERDQPSPLVRAILESRKGQADLSAILGERVRRAVEILAQSHEQVLHAHATDIDHADLYRAAVRMVMRLVVTLFAEARELLPADNEIYHAVYSVRGLRDRLERDHVRSPARLVRAHSAWPHLLALFRLIHDGCAHEALPVPRYGGELFEPGDPTSADGVSRAVHLFETACFDAEVMPDRDVHAILDLLTRTRVRIRQGRSSTLVAAPVNFAELDNEYIGILYEGLLDYELRAAPSDQPVVFLNVGNQPALPLATLEAMDDASLESFFKELKKKRAASDDGEEDEEAEGDAEDDSDDEAGGVEAANDAQDLEPFDAAPDAGEEHSCAEGVLHTNRTRAERWARRACEIAGIVSKPRGRLTPERQLQHEATLARAAQSLVDRVILPREWYLVRWGGTRKGSGTFYTKPQLAVPTVHRTLRPLAFDPPTNADGSRDLDAAPHRWTPKQPEAILALKVCDPACGSGSFPLAALRFLTDALFQSVVQHRRLEGDPGRPLREILGLPAPLVASNGDEPLREEKLPCRPEDDRFEERFKAVLRRHVVERCIYGVDLDPLAAELCRLALWIETMDRDLPFSFIDHKVRCGNALVGAWFDQFFHYPVMAWEREGGDKSHSNGVHFAKEAFTKAIATRKSQQVKPDLIAFIDSADMLFRPDLAAVATVHDEAERALRALHELPVHETAERSRRFRALRETPAFSRLKDAFDLWCAMWFWPGERIDACPLPTEFAAPSEEARAIAREVAGSQRFFHWELEFPDVFHPSRSGFDAIVGNPPWETLQPNSKEFFSNRDPMYRGYGKQEALRRQTELFADVGLERSWLVYVESFNAYGNWRKYAGFCFGDRVTESPDGRESHDFNVGDRGRGSFATSSARHERWRARREQCASYSDAEHPFKHQGAGKAYTYKMFVELAHALLVNGGRFGLVLPSGLYSDHGTRPLRELFIDRCRWEWLFGFENREGIFDIHRSFKFNPVIIQKGGETAAIRTAFMRRRLEDWEDAERHATRYAREQVRQFSPNSLALLEIQSQRDLEILTKIYANSVLLGDQSEKGWGITYAQGDFNMTSDSRLFPPRPKWEEWGYRPDEYSRWIKGPWKPIAELWRELGVNPSRPTPVDVEIPAWAFKENATPEERAATKLKLHSVTIRPGDVARTAWRVRCAQPPYDTLPIPRADIPPGVILSREADAWIREYEIPIVTFTDAGGRPLKIKRENEDGEREEVEVRGPAVALPLYEGRMIGQFDFSEKGWVSGKGRSAVWREIPWNQKRVEPQFLMASCTWSAGTDPVDSWPSRLLFMDVTSATNSRTLVSSIVAGCPAGNKVPVLMPRCGAGPLAATTLSAFLNSFVYDFSLRRRLGGTTLNWFIAEESAVPMWFDSPTSRRVALAAASIALASSRFAPLMLRGTYAQGADVRSSINWPLESNERAACRAGLDSIVGVLMGLKVVDALHVLAGCDLPRVAIASFQHDPKGFWRVDKDKHPEHRHTVLTLIAFHDLMQRIDACGGDRDKGIESFLNQNDGEGWMLPETLRLADYGLGHDDRAQEHQPVRSFFGPRFYDWQLTQTPEESWRECHLHARNLLGADRYQAVLRESRGEGKQDTEASGSAPVAKSAGEVLAEVEDAPLFQMRDA